MASELPAKRPKKGIFNDSETMILIAEVKMRYSIIKENTRVAAVCLKKCEAWKEITDSVNAVGGFNGSVESVKKRWSDLESEARKCFRHAHGTGGGPPQQFKFYDELMELIGERRTLDGVVGDDVGDTFVDGERQSYDKSLMIVPGGANFSAEFTTATSASLHKDAFMVLEVPDDAEMHQVSEGTTEATAPEAGTSVIAERAAGDPQLCSTPQRPPGPQTGPLRRKSVPTLATQQPEQKKKNPVVLSEDNELNDQYLRSCIELNQSCIEVNNAKVEKLKLQIMLLKKQLKDE